jgi:hypothetical protein
MQPPLRPAGTIERPELEQLWEEIGIKPREMTTEQQEAYRSFVSILDKRDPSDTDRWLAEHGNTLVECWLAPLAVAEILHQGWILGLQLRLFAARKSRVLAEKHFDPKDAELGRLPGLLVTGRALGWLPAELHQRILDALEGNYGEHVVHRHVADKWLIEIRVTPTSRWEWKRMRKRDARRGVTPTT